MNQLFFIDLHPIDMEGDQSANHHLIKVVINTDTEKVSWPDRNKTHCGRYFLDKEANISNQVIVPDSFKDKNGEIDPDKYDESQYMDYVRLYLAREQNSGIDICAHCVAKFYKFEEGDED